jgi:site-specific recombinase XerD
MCKELLKYCSINHIKEHIFITKSGKFIDRRNIWRDIKNLCKEAKVNEEKVFPHNLRHCFTIEFYNKTKDLDKLAHILGHSSIETSRIYTAESIDNYRILIEKIELPRINTT